MTKTKQAKLTTSITPRNTHQEKLFIQVEGKLTEAQLEAITAGALTFN